MCRKSTFILASLLLAVSLSFPSEATSQPSSVREGRIKAAILFYMTKFVSWPIEAEKSLESHRLCLIGKDPMNSFVEDTVKGKKLRDKPFALSIYNSIPSVTDLKSCQIIFFGTELKEPYNQALEALKGSSVLTIGVQKKFTAEGGMVRLYKKQNKIKILINIENAKLSKLKFSSELFQVAEIENN